MPIMIKIDVLSDEIKEEGEKPKKIHRQKLIEETISIENNQIELSPSSLMKMFPSLKGENIYGFNATINCKKAIIKVLNFEYFTLRAFADTAPSFSYLKVLDIDNFFRLNGMRIDRLDVERSSLLLVESKVRELNVGIASVHKSLTSDSDNMISSIEKIDIRGSEIQRARIFVPNDLIKLRRSKFNYLTLERKANYTNEIRIAENSSIERFKIYGEIDQFKISNSNIFDLEFTENSFVKSFKEKFSLIKRTHNCFFKSFNEMNMNTLQLIIDSARNNNDHKRYTDASYEYIKLKNKKNKKIFSKVISKIMNLTCGYGYKPLRPIISSFAVWLFLGIIYWVLPMIDQGGIKYSEKIVDNFVPSIYYSIITFTTTGYGDIVPQGLIAKTLSGIESILGIVLASLFIFTLTKRFGNLY